MSTTTPYLGLVLYDSTGDQSTLFSTFRAVWGGTATTSNFYKIDTGMSLINTRLTTLESSGGSLAEGTMLNGRILPSVTSNNLTVALKTFSGGNPSVSDPVHITLNGVVQTITAPLAVSANAGTNWFNSGSDELKTHEQDYFVYLGFNATDGVVLGISRIPYATEYANFSPTSTSDRYARISNTASAISGDPYSVIGRFSATLSGTSAFNWSVPLFSPDKLIQHPIYDTQWMDWTPVTTPLAPMTFSTSIQVNQYKLSYGSATAVGEIVGTIGGTATPEIALSIPIEPGIGIIVTGVGEVEQSSTPIIVNVRGFVALADTFTLVKNSYGNYSTGSATLTYNITYPIS
jgi:hypothetical protein